jgi:hypothetical protein
MKLAIAVIIVTLALSGSAMSQTCTYDWTGDYEQLTRLTDQFNPTLGDGDSMTVPILTSPASDLLETWYVPRLGTSGCPTGASGFYREYNSTSKDHRDTPTPGDLSGYLPDITLGCPWTSSTARQGLISLKRYFKSSINDHQTWLSTAPSGYSLDANFSSGTTARYGYQRFGNSLTRANVLSSAYGQYFLDNGVLRVDFNKIWGNSIGKITQASSGIQIVREGLGAQVQTSLRFSVGQDAACGIPNPTQSGGHNCANGDPTQWAGSPVISTTLSGTDPNPQTLTSVVRPLDYCNNGDTSFSLVWPNADPFSPLAWKGFFQRTDTLSCKLGTLTRKDVLKTSSQVKMGEGSGRTSNTGNLLNTHWLQEAAIGDAKLGNIKLERVDLSTGTITNVPIAYNSGTNSFELNGVASNNYGFTPTAGTALIVSKTDGSFGYALVMLNPQFSDFMNISFFCGASCDPPNVTIVLQAIRLSATYNDTSWSSPLDSFLVINNRSTILTRINEIYSDGGDCLN